MVTARNITNAADVAVFIFLSMLTENVPLEVRRRAELLLPKLAAPALPTGERLRTWRALAVLEQLGTPEAVGLLRELAGGAPGAWLTRQAQLALQRRDRRGA